MNQVQNIFSIPVYAGEVRDKEKLNESLMNSTLIKENKLRYFEGFTGDFINSFNLDENLEENWVDDLFAEIKFGMKDYVGGITKKGKPLPNEMVLTDIWFNSYAKGQYQEPHVHLGFGISSPFSFIYYLKLPKESPGSTVFLNDGFKHCQLFYSNHLKILEPSVAPDVKEGNYIIFPSFLTHYVIHHSSESERRITIAGNIELFYDEDDKKN